MNKLERLVKWATEHPDKTFNNKQDKALNVIIEEEKHKARGEKRVKLMFRSLDQGLTLESIGKEHNLTRERVRQILKAENYDLYKRLMLKAAAIRHAQYVENSKTTYVCAHCNKKFQHLKKRKKKYCSRQCMRDGRTKTVYPAWVAGRPIQKRYFTPEEWKELNRWRANDYYHRNIDTQRERLREYQRNNKERQALYAKRWAERKKYGRAITPLPDPKNIGAMKD